MSRFKALVVLVCVVAAFATLPCHAFEASAESGFRHFITRQGDRLMDGDKPWRFIGGAALSFR